MKGNENQNGQGGQRDVEDKQKDVLSGLNESNDVVEQWVEYYLAQRRGLVQTKTIIDGDPSIYPPSARILGWAVVSDGFQGDSLLKNLTGGEITKFSEVKTDSDHGLVRCLWEGTKAASSLNELLFKWKNTRRLAVPSARPRILE